MGSALATATNTLQRARGTLAGDYTGVSAREFDNGMDRLESATNLLTRARAEIQHSVGVSGRITDGVQDETSSVARTVGVNVGASWT
ncbi:hypothetical protein [Micromonospora violae]|uniref:hypothetical protein n=1 Tax=Micromonospora violae TaxID=1278207 RepID=UPI0033F9A754